MNPSEIQPESVVISITMTLFILSLITEKITNFLKLYFPVLSIKQMENSEHEKKRERTIQWISVFTGIFVAFLCNADFFRLIQEQGNIVFWSSINDLSIRSFIGCMISGIFLSQGSKFFHDLLDTVLYYKNMKRTLANKQEIENIQLSKTIGADQLIAAVTADMREDEPYNNL